MADRLTWQQVAAPDMRGAMQSQLFASEQIGKAFSNVASVLGAIEGRNRAQENSVAMANALKIGDIGQWDKTLAERGIAGLGIDPSRASPELLQFIQGYREDLSSDRQDDFSYGKGVYDFGRQQIGDQRSDKAYEETEASKQLAAKSLQSVFQMVPETASKEDLRGLVENRIREQKLDAVTAASLLGAVDQMNDAHWSVGSDIAGTAKLQPEFRLLNDALSAQRNQFNIEHGANDIGRLYSDGLQSYSGYANPGLALIDKMRGQLDPAGDEKERESVFAESAGGIQSSFNYLSQKFPAVPKEIIGKVLENSLQDNGWILTGDKVEFDLDTAEETLSRLATPESLKGLEAARANIESRVATFGNQQAKLDRAAQKWELAKDNGDEEGMQRAMAELSILSQELGIAPQAPGPKDGQAIMDRPVSAGSGPSDPTARMEAALAAEAASAPRPTPVQKDILDPRIIAQQNTIAPVAEALSMGVNRVGDLTDKAVGEVAYWGAQPVLGLQRASGYGTALYNPQRGGEILQRADGLSKWANAAKAEGLVAPAEQKSVMEGADLTQVVPKADRQPLLTEQLLSPGLEEDPQILQAMQTPAQTFAALAAETGIEFKEGSPISRAMRVLETGVDPETRRFATDRIREQSRKILSESLKRASKRYKGAGNGDIMQKLLQNPDAWIK